MIEKNNLHFSFVEIKVGLPPPRPTHAPHMEIDATWWNYIQTAYFLPDKIVQMRNTMSSDSNVRSLFFEFSTLADREVFFTDAQVLAGFDALSAYDNANKFKLLQIDENRSFPLTSTLASFPFTQWIDSNNTLPVGLHGISGRIAHSATA